MQLLSIEPFIPSGPDFEKSKDLFQELGFQITFDAGDYVGFKREACQFILQKFDHTEFAENLMISVKVDNVEDFLEVRAGKAIVTKIWRADFCAEAAALRKRSEPD